MAHKNVMNTPPDQYLYPNFREEKLDVKDEDKGEGDLLQLVQPFAFRVKGKRKDDLVVFRHGRRTEFEEGMNDVLVYENPRNLEFDEGVQDERDLIRWKTLVLQELKQPSSCISADITGNGFYDLIISCEYGESIDKMDPYGGRICWLENYGTNEGDWTCHEVGRFPGVNCIKVGHFSTTYSLQLLAVVKSSRSETHSPLIVFTRPPDIYKSRHWLVATALEGVFSAIQDCLVVESASGALDNIIVSSQEGLTNAWYYARAWHYDRFRCANLPGDYKPGRICAGKVGRDPVASIVSTELNRGAKLSIFRKGIIGGRKTDFRDIEWTHSLIYDFADGLEDASILDVLCEDLDGDGVDEIIVSLSCAGSNCGIYYLVQQDSTFSIFKLSDSAVAKIAPGHFSSKDKLDLAVLVSSKPRQASILYNFFVSSQIKPSVEGEDLILSIPRLAAFACETDVIDVAGYLISLIILPPNASFNIASDGSEAVKVLHGLLGWIDNQSELIERTRAACPPDCVTPMLVDSPEGHVSSGDDGAVFVRMRPSAATDAAELRAINVLPFHLTRDVRAFDFQWQRTVQRGGSERYEYDSTAFHLQGFRVRFADKTSSKGDVKQSTDVSYVHFWAAAPGSSSGFTRDIYSAGKSSSSSNRSSNPTLCSIRACLSNPDGMSGLKYCSDAFGWGSTPPTPYHMARARNLVLPVMYEHGPLWRIVNSEEGHDIEYPWHKWVTGRVVQRGPKWNVWAVFDFPAFEPSPHSTLSDNRICTIC